jgi:DNA-directed RNA polymerase specialized sigma24 family protein
MHGVGNPFLLDRPPCGHQGLTEDLAAIDALPSDLRACSAEQVRLETLKIQEIDECIECSTGAVRRLCHG